VLCAATHHGLQAPANMLPQLQFQAVCRARGVLACVRLPIGLWLQARPCELVKVQCSHGFSVAGGLVCCYIAADMACSGAQGSAPCIL
jgi:hypothetical protein